ncbi:MAG TPA: alanine racemase [Thermoanaerobaculia bacterium]|jgi:alanine racemase|nr:alanine racemase [Thermoanaerobaculia bacterium]
MSTLRESRPTYAFVDLDQFGCNVDVIARSLPSGARLVAVLKADAYGHGAVELAKRLTGDRVAMIAVSLLEEALELRRAGIELPLLVLGPVTREQIVVALDNRITIGIVGPEELGDVCAIARERDVAIHLKLDSGMGRMGIVESELSSVITMIRATPRLRIDGSYTHFANADDAADPFTDIQIANYDRMLAVLREAGIDAPLHHFANSAATLRGLVRPGDFARVGIGLYGPEPITIATGTIEPVLRWRTEILRLKELPPGHAIGYGTTFHTKRPSRIATLPVGYADGYDRLLSNNAEVLVRGRRAPVVGRVSMDLVTIDVTDIADAAIGDEVVLLGDGITAEELAKRSQTISYEVFCRISARVPRVYAEGGAFRIRSRFAQ